MDARIRTGYSSNSRVGPCRVRLDRLLRESSSGSEHQQGSTFSPHLPHHEHTFSPHRPNRTAVPTAAGCSRLSPLPPSRPPLCLPAAGSCPPVRLLSSGAALSRPRDDLVAVSDALHLDTCFERQTTRWQCLPGVNDHPTLPAAWTLGCCLCLLVCLSNR